MAFSEICSTCGSWLRHYVLYYTLLTLKNSKSIETKIFLENFCRIRHFIWLVQDPLWVRISFVKCMQNKKRNHLQKQWMNQLFIMFVICMLMFLRLFFFHYIGGFFLRNTLNTVFFVISADPSTERALFTNLRAGIETTSE